MNIKTDPTGYLVFENGLPVMIQGKESIAQNIRSRLRTVKGEYFLDTRIGFDYQNAFEKGNKRLLQYEIKKAILSTPGVRELRSFEMTIDDKRTATFEAVIETIDNETIIYRGL